MYITSPYTALRLYSFEGNNNAPTRRVTVGGAGGYRTALPNLNQVVPVQNTVAAPKRVALMQVIVDANNYYDEDDDKKNNEKDE